MKRFQLKHLFQSASKPTWLQAAQRQGQALLAVGRGRLAPALRMASPDALDMAAHGLALAQDHGPTQRAGRAAPFFPRLRQNVSVLDEAHSYIALQELGGHHVGAAGDWLLDNIELLHAQTREVQSGLPRRYFSGLPVLAAGLANSPQEGLQGLPRVYAIAWSYVVHSDGVFSPTLLLELLLGYQQEQRLTHGELWALPTTLRVVLIENLRRLAEGVACEEAARAAAHALCDGWASTAVLPAADPRNPSPADTRTDTRTDTDITALFAQLQSRGVFDAYALQVMQRLHADSDSGTAHGARSREAMRQALALALPDPNAAFAAQQAKQAADNRSVGNAVRSLQVLGVADWRGLIAQASPLVRSLTTWPAFAAEREDTQDFTLHALERLALRSGRSETEVARTLLELAATTPAADGALPPAPHTSLGYWLGGAGSVQLRSALGLSAGSTRAAMQRLALPLWLAALLLGSLVLTWLFTRHALAGGSPGWLHWLVAALAVWPASEAVVAVVNRFISEWVPPKPLPRLDFNGGIPQAHRVLLVVPAMLTDMATVAALARRLELHHLANRQDHAQLALLTDWADADSQSMPGDAALLDAALAAIETLELRHAPARSDAEAPPPPRRFLLLHRPRRWSDSEQRWLGHERKRGKLEELVALLAGAGGATFVDLGPVSAPAPGTPYVLTLDSDTVLPPGALAELVAVAAHPLNQARVDLLRRRVVAGYGILQPRLQSAWPTAAQNTGFLRLFAGGGGTDAYTAVASEVYQDLFGEGSFTGKGLFHVAALQAVLGGRLPDEQVLSHDLLEGCMAHCASVSDVPLIEAAPGHADVAAARVHRWTRGDWQLLPMLFSGRRYGLRVLDRFKLLDNLRRSLFAPAAMLLLLLALAGLPLSPWAVLALAAAAFSAGPLVGAIAGLAPSRDDLALNHFARQALAEVARAGLGLLWHLALWLRLSVLVLDAVGLALWRSFVSRRQLLQWTTAAASEAAAQTRTRRLLRLHGKLSLLAVLLAVALLVLDSPTPGLALALCLLWAATPLWIGWASAAPRGTVGAGAGAGAGADSEVGADLSRHDADYLREVARDTWRWFEQHVGESSNHLPPDNVQTVPRTMVAERTSPTNIGLYLLALACARSFGWVSTAQMAQRLQATLDTLDRLPRQHGHFMNWIDTRTLQTLQPAYVSAVDSGNLCGHLLAVATACDEAAAEVHVEAQPDALLRPQLERLAQRCRRLAEECDFAPLYDRKRRLLHIGWRAVQGANGQQPQQSPPPPRVQLDDSHYDLLASEARLASVWAIAKGDVPAHHWAALGRPFQASRSQVGLRSWSGSMFEYLMPTLVLEEPEGSALARAGQMAVAEQRLAAAEQHLPWGVSECAYAAADRSLAYQYSPQGVASLALRRTPPDERVVAPYASALAAMLQPLAATANLRRLQGLSARRAWGFIEALDYTVSRQESGPADGVEGPYGPDRRRPGRPPYSAVSTFMAHHQGMTVVALANVLLQGLPRRWCMADARIAAVATLLQERVPREVNRMQPLPAPVARYEAPASEGLGARKVLPGAEALQRTQMLSNGRYSVALRANGAGFSRWLAAGSKAAAVDITRWRDDALRDDAGTFIYLRRAGQLSPVSVTQHPAPDAAADYSAHFHADRVSLQARWSDLRCRCTVWVDADDDVELRRVELWNTSAEPITLEVMSAFEVCLSAARADEMHPAFANLFVSAEWDSAQQALHLSRQPRRAEEASVCAAHFVAHADASLASARGLTERARWRGRLHPAWQPLADFDAAPNQSGPSATGLDPVAALCLRVTLAPHGTAQLCLATAAGADRAALNELVMRCRQAGAVAASLQRAATRALMQQRDIRLASDERLAVQTLCTLVVLLHARPRAERASAGFDRRALWRLGLSGERPLLLVNVTAAHGLRMVRALVQGLLRWADASVECDLVIVNNEPVSYLQPLRHDLVTVQERFLSDAGVGSSSTAGSVGSGTVSASRSVSLLLVQAQDLSDAEAQALANLARARLNADGRPLAQHVAELVAWHDAALAARDEQGTQPLVDGSAYFRKPARTEGGTQAMAQTERHAEMQAAAYAAMHAVPAAESAAETAADTAARTGGTGATGATGPGSAGGVFDQRSGSFVFQASRRQPTPRPWVNILANPDFGAMVSEAGAGCSWAGNSRLHQLTPWSNDALLDSAGETFVLQDLDTRQVWNLGAGVGCAGVDYSVEQAPGRTRISHRRGDIEASITWSVDAALAVKRVQVQLHNHGQQGHNLRVVGLLEWLMGAVRMDRQSVHTSRLVLPAQAGLLPLVALLATQNDNNDGYGGHTAFVTLQRKGDGGAALADWTCDRRELFDARGHPVLPDHLGQRAGSGSDPCAALSTTVRLAAGAVGGCVFYLGHADSAVAAGALAQQALQVDADSAAAHSTATFQALLGAVTVHTPDPLFDALVNHWLLYQTTACRLWGRAGFYQAGGAYGFRDQLQDAMALATTAPQLLREHLLRAAARQYPQGDVQHWWHPHSGAGVRTHFSDDLLWLPHAVHHYLQATEDAAVLDENVPFIEGPPVPAGAEDLYCVPAISSESATLYEHCARSLDHSLAVGVHGLPLMGGGDWNDGMNRVGEGGRGESVWLAWFLLSLVADFAPLAQQRGDSARAQRWKDAAQGWQQALQGPAWDGAWYRRAFFDDGSALGSGANAECRIDLIAQAWSVLAQAAPTGEASARQQQAMASAQQLLFGPAQGQIEGRIGGEARAPDLLRLLDPPLQHAQPSAGYIQAYTPGVRENGGQYNHGATWAVMAWAQLGQADLAYRAWQALSSAHRAAGPQQGATYGLEPYVAAADVYSQPPYVGRGGWSWYTGAAGALHRAAVTSICGLQVRGDRVRLQPALPSQWPSVQIVLRRDGREHRFTVCQASAWGAVAAARADGALPLSVGAWLPLALAGARSHHLVVVPAPITQVLSREMAEG